MKGTKIYIYGLLDDNDNIVYIGKSNNPRARLLQHKQSNGYTKAKILDYFYDKESYYVKKYLDLGYKLYNKELLIDEVNYKIGEVIILNSYVPRYKITNTLTGEEYNSFYEVEYKLNITKHMFLKNIKNNVKDYQHYLVEEKI